MEIALESCSPRPATAVVSRAELTTKRESRRWSAFSSRAKALVRFEAREAMLKPWGLRQLEVEIQNPVAADFGRYGQHLNGKEIDFDDVRPGATEATLLSLRVRYLYELRVPFANRVIQAAWLGMRAKLEPSAAGLAAVARGGRYYLPLQAFYTLRMQSNPYLQWAHK